MRLARYLPFLLSILGLCRPDGTSSICNITKPITANGTSSMEMVLSITHSFFDNLLYPTLSTQYVREVCCEGFAGLPGNCQPICKPACVHAECTAPQQCTCRAGYETVDRLEYSKLGCQPVCEECHYGDCTEPDVCTCWPGFEVDSTTKHCHPIPNMLLPLTKCASACICWRKYLNEKEISTHCLQTCNTAILAGCLNTTYCLCNGLNENLICDVPHQKELAARYVCIGKESPASHIDLSVPLVLQRPQTDGPRVTVKSVRPRELVYKGVPFPVVKDVSTENSAKPQSTLIPILCFAFSCVIMCAVVVLVIFEFWRKD